MFDQKVKTTILKQEKFTKITYLLIYTFFPNIKCLNTYNVCVIKHNNNTG